MYLDCLYDTRVGLWRERGGQRYRNTLYAIFLTFICRFEMKKKIYQPRGHSNISWRLFLPLLDLPSSDRVWYFSQTPTPDSQPPQNFFKSQKSRLPPWKHFLNQKAYERKILNKKQITLNHFCLFFCLQMILCIKESSTDTHEVYSEADFIFRKLYDTQILRKKNIFFSIFRFPFFLI